MRIIQIAQPASQGGLVNVSGMEGGGKYTITKENTNGTVDVMDEYGRQMPDILKGRIYPADAEKPGRSQLNHDYTIKTAIRKTIQADIKISRMKSCLQSIFSELERIFGVPASWDPTYILNVDIEKHDSAHPAGESWIQVLHSRDNMDIYGNSIIYVERYFQSEIAQDEYGKSNTVKIDATNKQESVAKVLNAVSTVVSY